MEDKNNLSDAINAISIDDQKMTTSEQIEFYIKNKMPFMLHGMSGVGKSRRIKDIDKDFVSIYLRNGMLPEEVIGKTIYPNNDTTYVGKWVAPSWYGDLCDKCEREKDKIHVLFIDELTNAKETVQSLAYHLVLDHSIAPNLGKLPENCVVVCAGNSRDESEAANVIPEPLFRRFVAHIYLQPNIQDWVEWGQKIDEESGHDRIHPVVRAFVSANSRLFCSKYDPEDPPKYALDPRAWEQVSDVIYASSGRIALEIIENKIGKDNATKFVNFVRQYVPISVQDILSGKYDKSKLPTKADEIFAFVLTLTSATNEQVGIVRDFVANQFGNEYLTKYDLAWINDDLEKAIVIDVIKKRKIASAVASKLGNEQNQNSSKAQTIKDIFGIAKNSDAKNDLSNKLKDTFTVSSIDKCLDKNAAEPNVICVHNKEQFDVLAKVLDSHGSTCSGEIKYTELEPYTGYNGNFKEKYFNVRKGGFWNINPAQKEGSGISDKDIVDISNIDMTDELTDDEMKIVYGEDKYKTINNVAKQIKKKYGFDKQRPAEETNLPHFSITIDDFIKSDNRVNSSAITNYIECNSKNKAEILEKIFAKLGFKLSDGHKDTDYSPCKNIASKEHIWYASNGCFRLDQPYTTGKNAGKVYYISDVDMTKYLTDSQKKRLYGESKIGTTQSSDLLDKFRKIFTTTIDECLDENSSKPYRIIVHNNVQYRVLAKVLNSRGATTHDGSKYTKTKSMSSEFKINVREGTLYYNFPSDNSVDITDVDMIKDLTLDEIRIVYGDDMYQDVKNIIEASSKSI